MSCHVEVASEFRKSVEYEICAAFNSTMDKLETFWDDIGYTEDRIGEYFNEVLQHVKVSLENLVEEEKESYLKIKHRIKTYKAGVALLCLELDEEVDEPEESLSLLQKENFFRAEMDTLMGKKQIRMEKYKQMQKMENRLCGILGMAGKTHVSSTIPKQQELCELEQRIHLLSDEKERRYHKYWAAKRKLSIILEETDFLPETALDREVMRYNEDEDHILSQERIDQLHEVLSKVEQFQQKVKDDVMELTGKLDSLWNELNVDEKTRENFKTKHSSFRRSTIIALKHEIDSCKELKIRKMQKRVNQLRGNLIDLWQKCFVSTQEKCRFEPFYSEKYSDELVRLHEIEINRLNKYYNETKGILEKINRRQELWEKMTVFERKACDPHRFQNRGGNLLQEEKERKQLLKDLPALEEEILRDIGEYEDKNDTLFLVDGINFSEFIERGWNKHRKEKENNRVERRKKHSAKTNSKVVRKPSGIGPVFGVPSSAPSKMLGVNVGSPSSSKQPLTAKKLQSQSCKKTIKCVNRLLFTTPRLASKETLKEKNGKRSVSTNTTSYDDFVMELDKNYSKRLHNTAASKRKVLGSKINRNGSFRKSRSSSTSTSTSSRSSSKTVGQPNVLKTKYRTPTKTTPVRGKLGLPFLL